MLHFRARAAAFALAVGALTSGWTVSADACSCASSEMLWDRDNIPTNGKLFLEDRLLRAYIAEYEDSDVDAYGDGPPLSNADYEARLSLVRVESDPAYLGLGGAGGEPQVTDGGYVIERVPLRVTTLEVTTGFSLIVIHPDRSLTPGQWHLTTFVAEQEVERTVMSLTVTSDVVDTLPETPIIESVEEVFAEGQDGSSCGDHDTAGLSIEFSEGDGFLLLDGTADERYSSTALDGPISKVILENGVFLGQGTCAGGVYEPGEKAHFRVRRVDWAGNVSDWSEPADATLPEETPEGCLCSFPGALSGTAWPSAALATLPAALWLARRRRRGMAPPA